MPAMETRFHVSEADASAYRAAIGMMGSAVPTGLIMRLVGDDDVMAWLRQIFGARIPIHIKQACEIVAPLEVDRDYRVDLSCVDPDAATPVLNMTASPVAGGEPALILAITFALVAVKDVPS